MRHYPFSSHTHTKKRAIHFPYENANGSSIHTGLKRTLTHHENTLPGHPSDRKHSPPLDPVVISSVQVPAHAEVCDLDVSLSGSVVSFSPLSPNQAVTRGQVSVHEVKRRQELHPRCDLTRHGDEGRVAEAQDMS